PAPAAGTARSTRARRRRRRRRALRRPRACRGGGEVGGGGGGAFGGGRGGRLRSVGAGHAGLPGVRGRYGGCSAAPFRGAGRDSGGRCYPALGGVSTTRTDLVRFVTSPRAAGSAPRSADAC